MMPIPEEDNSYPSPTRRATSHARRERIAAGLFVALFAGMPILRTELYPFSRAPMFADAPLRYCEYTVTDPEGRSVDLALVGLQRTYWGNPLGVGVGFRPVDSLDVFGEVPSQEALTVGVQKRLSAMPALAYVDVSRTVIGPVDERHIGPVETVSWRVENPGHREPAR
jgi:hypothetical protein